MEQKAQWGGIERSMCEALSLSASHAKHPSSNVRFHEVGDKACAPIPPLLRVSVWAKRKARERIPLKRSRAHPSSPHIAAGDDASISTSGRRATQRRARCAWRSCAGRRKRCWGRTRRRGAALYAVARWWPRTWRRRCGSASSPSASRPRGSTPAPIAPAASSPTPERWQI